MQNTIDTQTIGSRAVRIAVSTVLAAAVAFGTLAVATPANAATITSAHKASVAKKSVVTKASTTKTTVTNRFGKPLDVDPAAIGAPANATGLAKFKGAATASWFGDWNANVKSDVAARVAAAAKRGAIATLVAYNIPDRDCGGFSAGGTTVAGYRTWITQFAAGLAGHPAIVVVEPDALSMLDCLTASQQADREGLIKFAVQKIEAQGSYAYIDAGHSNWNSATTMASRLKAAGIAQAAGFSLNVSNFRPTKELITFGTQLSGLVGNKHFVLDTSRNGKTMTNSQWCNPAGAGLGARPTTNTASKLVDAYLWVKNPGSSDGTCNGGPAAGVWFPAYAAMLAKNASF